MKMLPNTEDASVIRTDFESQRVWETIRDLTVAPMNEGATVFCAYVEFVDDSEFRDLTLSELLTRVPNDFPHSFLFVVDKTSTQHPEFPILIVDLRHERGRTFRAIPSQIQGIENNLSISNMDFSNFADSVDKDGVFRGFSNP